MESIHSNMITNMIPCLTEHVAVFNNGSEYKVIGWASRTKKQKISGDIELTSKVAGLITFNGSIKFAEECKGFEEYRESTCQNEVKIQ